MRKNMLKNNKIVMVLAGISCLSFSTINAQTFYLQSTGDSTKAGKIYTSSTQDVSAVEVKGGILNISNSTVSSTGNTSSNDNSSFEGLNAVMLATTSSGKAVINSSGNTVTSSGSGANGIFAYGTANITTTSDKLSQTGGGAHAIMCSGGGTIIVKNDTAATYGGSSSNIATDRGGGTITVTGGIYTSNGSNSVAIYSTGTITCSDATLIANGAEALVIEGSNYIVLNNCTIKCTYNKWGSMLYQSMSGDASGVDGHLTITGGSFTYTGKNGGMFYNTNSTAYYILSGVTLNNSCDTLIRCIKGSWGGSSASSGGITHFTAIGQTLSGLIYIDSNSKAYITLQESSEFTGAINPGNTASIANLSLDAASLWNVTEDSHLSGLSDENGVSGSSITNIYGNGHTVYYYATQSENSYLGGKTYALNGGGYLTCSTCILSDVKSATPNSASVSFYPNPANTVLNLKTGNPISQSLSVYNILGYKIYQNTISGNKTIDVSNWENGIYFISVNGQTNRIIIAH